MSTKWREAILYGLFIFFVSAAVTTLWCGCADEPVDELVTMDAGEDQLVTPIIPVQQNQPDTGATQEQEQQTCFIEYYVVTDTCLFYRYVGENCPRPPWWLGQDCNFETWEFPWDIGYPGPEIENVQEGIRPLYLSPTR